MSFKKIHLKVSQPTQANDNFSPGLNIKEIKPDYDILQLLIRLVGEKYQWHLRDEYHNNAKLDQIEDVLKQPESRLFLYKHNRAIVGFCCVANVEPNLTARFNLKSNDTIEIYKVGLFDEHTNKGWGKFFLTKTIEKLLKNYDTVYLNTRSTNHAGVRGFYEKLGMECIGVEEQKDDLISLRR